jgi:hypothetical protein
VLKKEYPKYPYPFLSWLPKFFHHPRNYKFVKNRGKRLVDLAKLKYVYVPLNFEPEASLMQYSPEFTNSLEMISLISKSLPVGFVIVVKEAPGCFGHRSRKFYQRILKMPNAVLAHPDVSSWDWIKKCEFVATITGTAAVEGVYFERPVLSYGMHQMVNHLPTVRYASNYETTRRGIKDILAFAGGSDLFKVSKEALFRAHMGVSFEIPGLIKLYKSQDLHMDLAKLALDNLYKQYPELGESGMEDG